MIPVRCDEATVLEVFLLGVPVRLTLLMDVVGGFLVLDVLEGLLLGWVRTHDPQVPGRRPKSNCSLRLWAVIIFLQFFVNLFTLNLNNHCHSLSLIITCRVDLMSGFLPMTL